MLEKSITVLMNTTKGLTAKERKVKAITLMAIRRWNNFEKSGIAQAIGIQQRGELKQSGAETVAFATGRIALARLMHWYSHEGKKPLEERHFDELGLFVKRNFHPQIGQAWVHSFSREADDNEIPLSNELAKNLPKWEEKENHAEIERLFAHEMNTAPENVKFVPAIKITFTPKKTGRKKPEED